MRDDANTGARKRGRRGLAVVALVAAALFVLVYRQVLGITQKPSWPPPPDAVTAAGAEAATKAFAARSGMRPHDAALDFAWSTAAAIEPWVEGANFFPRIFEDIEGAQSSVHILMFGWREGSVGMQMAGLLERKIAEGVEVRVIVDGYGSRPHGEAREMFTQLAASGAQIVVNDVFPLDRDGLFRKENSISLSTDVFQLTVILYELRSHLPVDARIELLSRDFPPLDSYFQFSPSKDPIPGAVQLVR